MIMQGLRSFFIIQTATFTKFVSFARTFIKYSIDFFVGDYRLFCLKQYCFFEKCVYLHRSISKKGGNPTKVELQKCERYVL